MTFEDSADPADILLRSIGTRLQVMERVVQSLLIMQLRDATDPQIVIERLRKYALGDEASNARMAPDFEEVMETYLATMEAIAHIKPPRR